MVVCGAQVNNMPQSTPVDEALAAMRDRGYGKFAGSEYPYYFWEPSAQVPEHRQLWIVIQVLFHPAQP
jgi:hypothetical protein